MRGNNLIPRPPYFADQFMGIKPPSPYAIKMVQPFGMSIGLVAQCKIPYLLDSTGGYITIDDTGTTSFGGAATKVKRYNAANALVGSYDISQLYGVSGYYSSGATVCYDPTTGRYYVPYMTTWNSGAGINVGLAYIASNGINLIGSNAWTNAALPMAYHFQQSIVNMSASMSAGKVSVIYAGNEYLFSVANGAMTHGGITSGGIAVPSNLTYRTQDGTIYASGIYRQASIKASIDVMRNGLRAKVPVSWLEPSSLTGEYVVAVPYYLGNAVYFAEFSKQYSAGVVSTTIADFDRWLHDVCDVMGL